jgi:hypothetical protein
VVEFEVGADGVCAGESRLLPKGLPGVVGAAAGEYPGAAGSGDDGANEVAEFGIAGALFPPDPPPFHGGAPAALAWEAPTAGNAVPLVAELAIGPWAGIVPMLLGLDENCGVACISRSPCGGGANPLATSGGGAVFFGFVIET